MNPIVRVGVSPIILCQRKILLGLRIGSHGAGTWAPPGGHIDWFETPEDTIKRELFEETGLSVVQLAPIIWTNDIFTSENKHYITLFYQVQAEGTVTLKEPNRCREWQLFALNQLPTPLFLPVMHLTEHYDLNQIEFESTIYFA